MASRDGSTRAPHYEYLAADDNILPQSTKQARTVNCLTNKAQYHKQYTIEINYHEIIVTIQFPCIKNQLGIQYAINNSIIN